MNATARKSPITARQKQALIAIREGKRTYPEITRTIYGAVNGTRSTSIIMRNLTLMSLAKRLPGNVFELTENGVALVRAWGYQ